MTIALPTSRTIVPHRSFFAPHALCALIITLVGGRLEAVASPSDPVDPDPSEVACEWTPFFGGLPGVDREVRDSVVFDDGEGLALYLAGTFTVAGPTPAAGIVRWDGESWTPLGEGLAGVAYAVAVHDDGSGPALYVGGEFELAGGSPATNIARWDGSTWSAVGAGLGGGRVRDLAVYDSGTGGQLFAAGDFTTSGTAPAPYLAAWDGVAWSQVGDGLDAGARELIVFDGGSGPELVVAGVFQAVGAQPFEGLIARWDGTGFTPLGTGVTSSITAMAVHDDGNGPRLWVSGNFGVAGGIPGAESYAVWDGATWAILPDTPNGKAETLVSLDLEGQQVLLAGGVIDAPSGCVVYWDGSSWLGLGSPGLGNGNVYSFATFDFGRGERLVALGSFDHHGTGFNEEDAIHGMAVLVDDQWADVESGLTGLFNTQAHDAIVFDDGSGPALFLAGTFTKAGGHVVHNILRWDGENISDLDGGLVDIFSNGGVVTSLAVYDDGTGPALYAGGLFNRAGGQQIDGLARWDGTSWSDVGLSITSKVIALVVWDDGTGEKLYVADLTGAEGGYVQCWDGTTWSTLGSDLSSYPTDMLVHDDGSGERLWISGNFKFAGGLPVERVATWDGTQFAAVGALGEGPDDVVQTMVVADLGSGPELVIGGPFGGAGPRIARWDGANWIAMPDPDGLVVDVEVWDGGTGSPEVLYVGGRFGDWQNDPTTNVLQRWTGSTWQAVTGLGAFGNNGDLAASSLMPITFDGVSELLVSGNFLGSAPGDAHLARLTRCDSAGSWSEQGASLGGVAGNPVLSGVGTLSAGSSNTLSLENAAPAAPAALFASLTGSPTPFKGGTLLPFPFLFDPVVVQTSAAGAFELSFTLPLDVPPATELWLQWAIADAAAVQGVSLSNALLGLTP